MTAQALSISSCDTNLLQQLVPAGSSPSAVALSADDYLTIDERATVTRTNGDYAPVLSAGSLVPTAIEGKVGDVKSRASVVVSYPGQINGSIISAGNVTVLPGASVTGTIRQNTSVAIATLQRTVTFPANPGSSVLVPIGGTRTITPGAYRDIIVPFGATLTMQPGEYHVRSMRVDLSGRVVVRNSVSPVYLYVRDTFSPGGAFSEEATGDLKGNLLVGVFHCQVINLLKPWIGTLIAPTSSVVLHSSLSGTAHQGAVFARSILVGDDAKFVHVPFPSNLIQRVDISDETPCQNEEIAVEVTTRSLAGPTTPVEVSINQLPGAFRTVQFMGAGQYFVTVGASQGHYTDSRTIAVDVQRCAQVFARVIQQPSLNQPYTVRFMVANADQITGINRLFRWDFGDGRSEVTPYPYIEHSYEHALDATTARLEFEAVLRITRDGLPNVVANETVSMRNHYASTRAQGYVRPPQTSDVRLVRDGKVLHGAYSIRNLESAEISYTSRQLQKHFCDPDLDPQRLPAETVTMMLPANGTLSGDLVVPHAEFGSNVCAVSMHLQGSTPSGLSVRTSIHFETPEPGLFVQPVTDPAVIDLLNDVAGSGMSSDPNRISDEELRRLQLQGRIGFVPTMSGFDTGALQSSTAMAGDRCSPEDEPANPGLVCVAQDDEWELAPPFIRNALKGDIFIVSSCEEIGELLRVMVPRQEYSHEGIFTRNYYTLSHSTANSQRILETVGCDFLPPGFFFCDNIHENTLRFAWPGAVLNATIYDAFHGEVIADPEGVPRQISGFDKHATACSGDAAPNPPILIRPVPADEVNARPLLHQAADFARSIPANSHYRWFGFSQANIAFDPPNNFSGGNFRDVHGERATVSTTFIWHALKSVPGIVLEGNVLEPSDLLEQTFVELPTGTGIVDGLYHYSEENRKRGARQVYNSTQNRVKDLQEARTLGIPGLDWYVEGWTDAADDIAAQFTNCFGFDNCGEDGAQSDAYENPGTGTAVSPDNFLRWDAPHMEGSQTVGVFGDTELLLYRSGDYRRVFRLAAAGNAGTVTGRVVLASDPLQGVPNAIVTLSGVTVGTDSAGNFALPPVPAATYEIRAEKSVLASDPTTDCPSPDDPNLPNPPPLCTNLVVVQPLGVVAGANPPVTLALAAEAAIPPPSVEVFARRAMFRAEVSVTDDDEQSPNPSADFTVEGFCEVDPFNRERENVAIPLNRDPVMCAGGEARVEITTTCRLQGDNETVEVDVRVDFFEDDSCSGDDRDDTHSDSFALDPCTEENGTIACNFVRRSIALRNEDFFELDDSRAAVDLTVFNVRGPKVADLPTVTAENMRRVLLSGNVHFVDHETWPAPNETADFDFEGECIVDPFDRDDVFIWSRCAGAEVRVDLEVTCRLGIDHQSVNVEFKPTMFEGTICANDDKDGVNVSEQLVSPCGASCSATAFNFSVRNEDEGGDRVTFDIDATNVQQ